MTIAATGGCCMKARVRHFQSKAMQGTARHGTPGRHKSGQAKPGQRTPLQSRPGHARSWRVFAPKTGRGESCEGAGGFGKRVCVGRCFVAAATRNTATFCAVKRRRFLKMYRAKPPTGRHFSAQKCAMFVQSGVAGLKQAVTFRRKHAP